MLGDVGGLLDGLVDEMDELAKEHDSHWLSCSATVLAQWGCSFEDAKDWVANQKKQQRTHHDEWVGDVDAQDS